MPNPTEALPRPLVQHISQLAVELPKPLSSAFFDPPNTLLCQRAIHLIQDILPPWTVNHCFRTYAFSLAIARYAGWDSGEAGRRLGFDRQGIFLACFLHEMGFVEEARKSRLSLEFWGAIRAREWILSQQADLIVAGVTTETLHDYADDAFEAIAMHTLEPILSRGRARLVPALCALGANQDLLGGLSGFIHRDTILSVVDRWPRLGYVDGLKAVALAETENKPGCLFETCLDLFMEPMYKVACFKGNRGI